MCGFILTHRMLWHFPWLVETLVIHRSWFSWLNKWIENAYLYDLVWLLLSSNVAGNEKREKKKLPSVISVHIYSLCWMSNKKRDEYWQAQFGLFLMLFCILDRLHMRYFRDTRDNTRDIFSKILLKQTNHFWGEQNKYWHKSIVLVICDINELFNCLNIFVKCSTSTYSCFSRRGDLIGRWRERNTLKSWRPGFQTTKSRLLLKPRKPTLQHPGALLNSLS